MVVLVEDSRIKTDFMLILQLVSFYVLQLKNDNVN